MNNKMFKTLGVLLVSGVLFTNCATIFKGNSADIRVNSNPSGATISVNNVNMGVTPQTMSLKRNSGHVLTFSKDGYEDVVVEIEQKFDIATTVVGNIFSWALLGIVVDVATGAAYSLTPADVQANFDKMAAAGIIDPNADLGENDIFVFMLTSEQWAELQD